MNGKRAPMTNPYDTELRLLAYTHQITLIRKLGPRTVLNIGKGTGFLKKYFESNNVRLEDLDIDPDTRPDYLQDLSIPFDLAREFDLVCAFQVLEHIPFDAFETGLSNIRHHTKSSALVALPIQTLRFGIRVDFPLLKLDYLAWFERAFKKKPDEALPQWEIGLQKTPKKAVDEKIRKFFHIREQFLHRLNPFHYYYVLEKK